MTTVKTGKPSMYMAWREIHHNFFIDNYSPQEDVDNDDGSCFYHTHDNFLVYGGQGMKNDFGKRCRPPLPPPVSEKSAASQVATTTTTSTIRTRTLDAASACARRLPGTRTCTRAIRWC